MEYITNSSDRVLIYRHENTPLHLYEKSENTNIDLYLKSPSVAVDFSK